MVEPAFLVALGVAFVLILVLILRQNSPPQQQEKKKERKPKSQPKRTPNKGPQKNSLKKDKRPVEVREWSLENPTKEAQDMLEFLKGKDPVELAKQHNQGKQGNKKKQPQPKKGKVDDSASEDSASEVSDDGFYKILKKPKGEKKGEKVKEEKKEKKNKDPSAPKKNKPFFKPPPPAEGEEVKEEEKPKRERKPRASSEGESTEGKEKPEGEKRERRERSDGEKRERQERPDRPQRKPLPTVAPIVKYEQADLTDILNSITLDFKHQPKVPKTNKNPKGKGNVKKSGDNRNPTIFSKLERSIVLSILQKLEAEDLAALSAVNHYFHGAAVRELL